MSDVLLQAPSHNNVKRLTYQRLQEHGKLTPISPAIPSVIKMVAAKPLSPGAIKILFPPKLLKRATLPPLARGRQSVDGVHVISQGYVKINPPAGAPAQVVVKTLDGELTKAVPRKVVIKSEGSPVPALAPKVLQPKTTKLAVASQMLRRNAPKVGATAHGSFIPHKQSICMPEKCLSPDQSAENFLVKRHVYLKFDEGRKKEPESISPKSLDYLKMALKPLGKVLTTADFTYQHPSIAKGGFGEVFKVLCKNETWAFKKVFQEPNQPLKPNEEANLANEVDVIRRLSHPGLVGFRGLCADIGHYGYFMEFIPGENLFKLLFMQRTNYSCAIRLNIAKELCSVMVYLHNLRPLSVIHRDIKSENLIFDSSGHVKLCDFGKSRMKSPDRPVFLGDDNGGSPRYMAPESFRANAYIESSADIWGTALCLLEIFAGPIAWSEYVGVDEIVTAVLQDEKVPSVPTWFCQSVRNLIVSCLVYDPAQRPTAVEVQSAIAQVKLEDLEACKMFTRRD